jgi:hypothetical protein
MSEAKGKVYDLAKIIESELGKAKPIHITAGEQTFEVPPPVMWPDSVLVAAGKAEQNDPAGVVEMAHGLLGDRYDDWVAAGGTAMLLFTIMREHMGAGIPESKASTDS